MNAFVTSRMVDDHRRELAQLAGGTPRAVGLHRSAAHWLGSALMRAGRHLVEGAGIDGGATPSVEPHSRRVLISGH